MSAPSTRRAGRPAAAVLAAAIALTVLPVAPGPAGAAVARPGAAPVPLPVSRQAGPEGEAPIMLVVDTSGSMGDDDGSGVVKIEGARSALLNFIEVLPTSSVVGLRTYPGSSGSCSTGTSHFSPAPRNPADVAARIRTLEPGGDTPTAEALLQAKDDLQGAGYVEGTIILVSDGLYTCGDPCVAAQEIAASGLAIDFIAVGFQISDEGRESLQCVAQATNGTYVDADDNEGLEAVLDDLTRPQVTLSLDHPGTVVADVGMGQGSVDITATVTNTGGVDAPAVKAQLRFDDITSAPGVVAPVRVLGNLPAGGAPVTVRWRFQAGLILARQTVTFSVIVRGRNLPADVVEAGSVSVVDASSRSDAGPLLAGAGRIAILGDSYSSGEGAMDYLPGTDTSGNTCHRSSLTYMVKTFGIADEDILACSGAVSLQVHGGDQAGQGTQIKQLADRQARGPVDAVVLTIGGNDAGFSRVATSCLIGVKIRPPGVDACNEKVDGQDADRFLEDHFAGLAGKLITTYRRINDVLNSADAVRARGRFAPIIVLGYPRILPGAHRRSCLTMSVGPFDLLTSGELGYVEKVVSRLNGVVEGSVRSAATTTASTRGLPIVFASTVEDSFLPDHTVCDADRYANGLQDARFYDEVLEIALALTGPSVGPPPWRFLRAFLKFLQVRDEIARNAQELLHPNPAGYRAMTRAVIRASLGEEADRLASRLADRDAFAVGSGKVRNPTLAERVLEVTDRAVTVSAHTTYPLAVDGLAPYGTATVTLRSDPVVLGLVRADAEGRVRDTVTVPEDVEPGRHHIVVEGLDPEGEAVRIEIAVDVPEPGPAVLMPSLAGASGLAALVGLVLRRWGRRARVRAAAGLDGAAGDQ